MVGQRTHTRLRAAALVATGVVIAAGVAAYVVLVRVQRDLFLNGLPPADGSYPRSGADLTAAAASLAAYWPLMGTVVGLYVLVLLLVRWAPTPWVGRVAVGAGALGQLAMLPTKPSLSIDLYSYVAHGYLANQPDLSPYTAPAWYVAWTPFGKTLFAAGWQPVHQQSPYGPLWTDIEALAYSASGGSVDTAALLMKIVVLLASIGSGVLIYLVAERIRRGAGLLAASAWLLCPVTVSEFAGDGHNDALSIFFVLLAIWAATRGWGLLAVPALTLGVLVKYTPAVFALALLVLVIRKSSSRTRALRGLAGGAAIGAVIAVLFWLRWWIGWVTLDGLRVTTTPEPSWSPGGWLTQLPVERFSPEPSNVPQLVLGAALAVVILASSWAGTARGAVLGCAVIAVAVLGLGPTYWPWYSALAIALLVLRPTGPSLVSIIVLTLGSRIAGPWGDVPQVGLMPFQDAFNIATLTGLTLPVACCALIGVVGLVASIVGSRRRRRRPTVLNAGESPPDRGGAEAAQP